MNRRGERILRAGFGENMVLKSRKLAFKSYKICYNPINIKEVIHQRKYLCGYSNKWGNGYLF